MPDGEPGGAWHSLCFAKGVGSEKRRESCGSMPNPNRGMIPLSGCEGDLS